MKNTITISLFFFYISFSAQANQFPVVVTNDNGQIKCSRLKNVDYFDLNWVIDSIKTGLITDTTLLACCYHQLAIEYFLNYDNINSIKYNKLAKHLRAKFNDGLYWRSELNLGINFFELNEFTTAIQHLKKAYQSKGFKKPKDSISILKNIAESYSKLGDYEMALEFSEQAIQVNASTHKKNEAQNSLILNLILSKDTNNLKKAIELSNKAYRTSYLNEDYDNLLTVLNNLGYANDLLEKYEKAIQYYEEAIHFTNDKDLESKAILLNDIATILLSQKKHKLSIKKLREAFAVFNDFNKNNYHFYIAINENMADNYLGLGKLDSALIFYQKAISKITNTTNSLSIFENPSLNDSIYIYSNPDLIRVLHLKGNAAFKYYKQNKVEKFLALANQTYQTAFDFHDQLQKDISTENSRLFQAKNIVPYLENALQVAYQQQENGNDIGETAFRFMEKNKATVLLQSMNEANALQFSNLPDSLVFLERDLKISITFHKQQLNDAFQYEDTIEINRLNKILFEQQQKYSQLVNNLENNYPDYYRLKYQQNQTKCSDVQNILNNETALLEYFVGDSTIYILSIQKERTKLFKIKKPENWKKTIYHFRNSVSLLDKAAKANPYTKKIYQQFSQSAYTLFQWLLKEPLANLDEINHLKIIPDAELNYIPFDILLTQMTDDSTVNYKTLSYLIKEKSIGYNYSAALMMEQKQAIKTKQDFSYGGYAPHYIKNDSIGVDLLEIRQLVSETAGLFNGKAYLSEMATKANFLKDTLSYKISHFAMHGILNDQYPLNSHLVFTPETPNTNTPKEDFKLYAADLYNLQLNTNLAILSACDTGAGELQRGEGVMSLSRAFTYAGCPSLVMSLWSIPEKSTAELLSMLFTKLKSNQPKDVALQQAKLDYLENTSATASHPNYWAGLVLSGNVDALDFENGSNKYIWWGLIFLIFLLTGSLLFLKKKKTINLKPTELIN